IGCGWPKPLNSLPQHPPLEIVGASFARSPHLEGEDCCSTRRNRVCQNRTTRSPSCIVLRVLRAELVSGSSFPGGVANVLHLDSHVVCFTGAHGRGYRLRNELRLVTGRKHRNRNVICPVA